MRPRKWLALSFVLLFAWPVALSVSAEPPPATITVPAFGEAESAKAQPITLAGPTALNVGQEGTWRLSGTPPVDLTKPLLDQLAWALGDGRMYVYVLAPGKPAAPLDIHLELVIAPTGATLQPVIRFAPTAKGEYRILVDWNTGQDQLAEILVTVGGPGPDPGPDPPNPPDPDPPLPPLVKWQVMFFYQSDQLDNLPQSQIDMISGLVFRRALEGKGHSFAGAFDVDSVAKAARLCGPRGCLTVAAAVPNDLKPWWAAVDGDPMPRVAIAPIGGGAVRDFPLPADETALYALLEGQK
jgi:hypothetical protein